MSRKNVLSTYLSISVGLFVFQRIYHHFGHGVVSPALRYCWVAPLVIGLLFLIFFTRNPQQAVTSRFRLGVNLMNTALATFTAGLILTGIVDIAGTDSPYILYFYIVGLIFLVPGSLLMLGRVWKVR